MLKKLLSPVIDEYKSFAKQEKKFFFLVLPLLFFIMAEYGVTRPVSSSLFIANYHTSSLPYVWIATVPLNLFIVYLYNRYLPHYGCKNMFLASSILIASTNVLTGLFLEKMPILIFFQYAIKDIYIMLVLKQAWSLVHSTVKKEKAKFIYGLFFAIGSVGALFGNSIPGFFALKLGSTTLFYSSVLFYSVAYLFYCLSTRYSNLPTCKEEFKKSMFCPETNSKSGLALFKKSKFLIFILLIVVFMQVSIALIYYEFNHYLEITYPDADIRSQFCARLHGLINLFSISFQIIGGYMFIHYAGLKKCHLLVPFTLLANAIFFIFKPVFGVISFFYAYIKATDFCFFSLIREMLFLPLSLEEKFRAKAIIDIFASRTARAGASLLLLGLQVLAVDIIATITYINIMVFVLWAFMVYKIFQQEAYTSKEVSS